MIGKMEVPLYRHNLIHEDTKQLGNQIGDMLGSMIISTGPVNNAVANMFAGYMERQHCLLTASWSAGMMATLMAIGLEPGDQVIVPAMTFAATANIVEALGAQAVFVDVDPNTKLIDIDKVLEAVTDKTKAIIPVHLYGQMVNMRELRRAVPRHIFIIEDAAHAIESSINGYRPGKYSDAAVFSFYQSKNMTTGEGGAVVTDSSTLYQKLKVVYRHGIDLCGYQRHIREEFIAPDAIEVGIKANMPDILAILLPPQIERAALNISRRERIIQQYKKELGSLLEFPAVDPNVTQHAWHICAVGIDADKRNDLLVHLHNSGIKTTVHFKAMHVTTHYGNKYGFKPEDFPNAYAWGERVFSLPVFPGLRDDEQNYVIETVKSWLV